MSYLDGAWNCNDEIVGLREYKQTISLAPALEANWMHAVTAGEEWYWIYVALTREWKLYTIEGAGNNGEFKGLCWQGNTFTWGGQRWIMAHTLNREITWTRVGIRRFEWREYDTLADNSNVHMFTAECTKQYPK